MKKIISVVGARPNFMKVAPIHKAFQQYRSLVTHLICHTGQHYDEKMSKVFFEDLELPQPDFYLGVGSGSHTEQTARVMIEFEKILLAEKPDLIIVVGDVNSTIACSLVASKMGTPIAHVEAGLRSFDRTMPEEVNRVLTDAISDFLFVTEKSGIENLKREWVAGEKVFFVGNVMIDSVVHYLPKAERSKIVSDLQLQKNNYILATLHRPSNVDTKGGLEDIVSFFSSVSENVPIVFPVHPRTRKNLEQHGLLSALQQKVILTEPIGYIDFLSLIKNAALIVTDSGGIQEESTYLKVPCVTVRNNTERPITVEVGTNYLAGTDFSNVTAIVRSILNGNAKQGRIPELWDGKAAERITKKLVESL